MYSEFLNRGSLKSEGRYKREIADIEIARYNYYS
jgi:hypothetical protein